MGVGAVLAGVVWMAGAAGTARMSVGCVELDGGFERGEGERGWIGVVASSLGAPPVRAGLLAPTMNHFHAPGN